MSDEFNFEQFNFEPGECQDTPLGLVTLPPISGAEGGPPSCPCGWGPNGIPQTNSLGIYVATWPPWVISTNPVIYVEHTHPTCMTWYDYNTIGIPMNPCWQEYLTMPFCIDQANGNNWHGLFYSLTAIGAGWANCRLASDLQAMTNQQRQDIFNNTYTAYGPNGWTNPSHTLGVHPGTPPMAWIPVFVMDTFGLPINQPNPLPPHQNGGWAVPAMRWIKIDATGSMDPVACFLENLACPNTCLGCTDLTSTTCITNPGACQAYDPTTSYFWPDLSSYPVVGWPSASTLCCISGCTTPGDPNYNPLATCDDGTCVTGGCMDTTACNYDPTATVPTPQNCYYGACRHPNAINYNPSMPAYDCDCNFIPPPHALNNPPYGTSGCCRFNFGCTDPQAYNYDPTAPGCDDGNGIPDPTLTGCCLYPTWHCQVPQGTCQSQNDQNGYPTQQWCDDKCIVGCTNPSALNYDPNATIPCGPWNGYPSYLSCCIIPEPLKGCMDSNAINYMDCCDLTIPGCVPTIQYDACCKYEDDPEKTKCHCCNKFGQAVMPNNNDYVDCATLDGTYTPSMGIYGCLPISQPLNCETHELKEEGQKNVFTKEDAIARGYDVTSDRVPAPPVDPKFKAWEWYYCDHLVNPCLCKKAPYVQGQQVLNFFIYSTYYLQPDDTSCWADTSNCCTTTWDCNKAALAAWPDGTIPSGWRYVCKEQNNSNGEFATEQACIDDKCLGDPNISYSLPCTAGHCTEHYNFDCGGAYTTTCWAYRQDCDAANNC